MTSEQKEDHVDGDPATLRTFKMQSDTNHTPLEARNPGLDESEDLSEPVLVES